MRLAAFSSVLTYLSDLLAFDEPVITSHDTLTTDPATGRSSFDSRCSTNRTVTTNLQRKIEKRAKLTAAFTWNSRRVSKHKCPNSRVRKKKNKKVANIKRRKDLILEY